MSGQNIEVTMERVDVLCDDELFDKVVNGGLPEGRDLRIVIKDGAMTSGAPGACLCFTVQLPDGELRTAQAVISVACLKAALRVLDGWFPDKP